MWVVDKDAGGEVEFCVDFEVLWARFGENVKKMYLCCGSCGNQRVGYCKISFFENI